MKTNHTTAGGLHYEEAITLAKLIRDKEISSTEAVQAHLDRIATVNPQINAMVTIVGEKALDAAKKADAALANGEMVGPLHGVPFTVKDSIDTADVLTQRGSPIFKGRIPNADATAVARMKQAGAILLGKTNLPEFSYWIESENLLTGRSKNPWDLTRTPGGSSGGESAAIAAGLSPIGLGTDLAISVRGPAAQTGIVSLKATHGRVPMTGIWPRAPRRFWHVGPMARSIQDLELSFGILAGADGKDGFSSALGDVQTKQPKDIKTLKIGWLVAPGFGPVDAQVAQTVEDAANALAALGASVEAVHIPALEQDFALEVFNKLHIMEMKPAFREAVKGRPENEIYKMAHTMLSIPETSYQAYIDAEQAAERLKDGFAAYFQQYDALITPVLPIPAHKHGVETFVIDGQTVDATYLQGATVPLNVTGLPGIAMRFGTSAEGLPINVQIVGKWLDEYTILQVAAALESVSPVRSWHPEI
ncbi:amidase [Olivibacter sp. SDN3]|uniref:amidase n=1 Tax=Olivibacter sp. SDN3 TaxID=2764720 RepID=UPI00165110FE|nr:amidase [Olivibacter sp. SDN3]QNL52313.1 amidase [Olivibacter sp. SDN3]